MINQIYRIPHTCFFAATETEDESFRAVFGKYPQFADERFDSVTEVDGFRVLQPIQRVRNHWVVDSWLECGNGETSKRTKLMTHNYLRQLIRTAQSNSQAVE